MAAALSSYTVVLPARFDPSHVAARHVAAGHVAGPARRVDNRPSTQVFLRRRLLVAVVFIAASVALSVGAGSVLANRGGAPASTSAVRPAITYVVQPGDTVWAIAQQFHGSASHVNYVDALVRALGGASLQVGQVITLP